MFAINQKPVYLYHHEQPCRGFYFLRFNFLHAAVTIVFSKGISEENHAVNREEVWRRLGADMEESGRSLVKCIVLK